MRHSRKPHFLPFFSVLLVLAAATLLAHATPFTLSDSDEAGFTFTNGNSSGASPIMDSAAQNALFYDTAKIGSGNLDLCLFNGPQCGSVGVEDSTLSVYYPRAFNANITAGSLHPETPDPTPEPASLALLGTGILAIAVFGRFKVFRDREDAK